MAIQIRPMVHLANVTRPSATIKLHTWIFHGTRIPKTRSTPLQRRTFLTPPLQRISRTKTLPLPSTPIFQTIASVSEYHSFLPYCLSSRVTRYSRPDALTHREWPEEAELEVGWGSVKECFKSRIYCVPQRVVEAVAGTARTRVGREEGAHHTHLDYEPELKAGQATSGFPSPAGILGALGAKGKEENEAAASEIMRHLYTRWEITPLPRQGETAEEAGETRVTLDIEVQFSNPVYAAMSQVAAETVAEKMMDAFESRVRQMSGEREPSRTEGRKAAAVGGQ